MRCLNCQTDNIALSAQICPTCGMNLLTIWGNALPMGTLLGGGKYRIDWLLGRGGFGITYRATHTVLGRVVAIKEFFPRDFVHRNVGENHVSVMPVSQADYERGLDRFLREGRVLSQIKEDHIVRVEDFFQDNETAYLVMELLDGKSLRTELKNSGGKFPQTRVVQIIEDLVQALTTTHAQKVWHCDIKPDNVQILPSGRAVLIDFGAAHQGMASQSTRAFTRDYAAPELETGKPVDGRTDLFELGMMIHEMVTGLRPPMAVDRMMKDTWSSSHLRNPWKAWLPPLLNMRPDGRPQSIEEWWKKRPRSVGRQLPVSVPLHVPAAMPASPTIATSPAISVGFPTSLQPGWGMNPLTTNSSTSVGPAPRSVPSVSPRRAIPKRTRNSSSAKFRKLLAVLTVLTPVTVFLMMASGILPVGDSSHRYDSYTPTGSGGPASTPAGVGPEQATKRLERVIREGQNEAAFRRYVDKGASLSKDDYKDGQGNSLTPLLYAIKKYGDADIVRLLAAKGAHINTKNARGETPLHYAARLGRVEAGQSLMEAGAQVNAKNDNGWTPLHVCAKYGQKTMADLLASNRANVNAKSNYGGTPLHVAAYYGQTDTAELLLAKGADVNAKDSDGGTPLHIAAHYGKEPIAELLLKKGAKKNELRDNDDTPLHVAIREAQFGVVSLLLAGDADVNARNKEGETPLHLIVRTGQQGLTEQVLKKGADVGAANNDGETALHLATRRGDTKIVELLLDHRANINAVSKSGETPLRLASKRGHAEIARLLLSRGAAADLANGSGKAPPEKANGGEAGDLLNSAASSPSSDDDEQSGGDDGSNENGF